MGEFSALFKKFLKKIEPFTKALIDYSEVILNWILKRPVESDKNSKYETKLGLKIHLYPQKIINFYKTVKIKITRFFKDKSFRQLYSSLRVVLRGWVNYLNVPVQHYIVFLLEEVPFYSFLYKHRSVPFYIKMSFKNFYFFKWTSVKYSIEIISVVIYFFKKTFGRYLRLSYKTYSSKPYFVQWLTFNFFQEDSFFGRIANLPEKDLQNLNHMRLESHCYPYFFHFSYEFKEFKKIFALKNANFSELKQLYKLYNNSLNQTAPKKTFLDKFNILSVNDQNSTNRVVLMSYLYSYTFISTKFLNYLHFKINSNSFRTIDFNPYWNFPTGFLKVNFLLFGVNLSCVNFKKSQNTPSKSFFYFFLKNFTPKLVEHLNNLRITNLLKQVEIYTNFRYNSLQLNKYNVYLTSVLHPNFVFNKTVTMEENKYFFKDHPVKIYSSFKSFMSYYWPARIIPNNFYKFNDINNNEDSTNMFLRKNKIFNKSRYSRNRQLYRTGVYFCLFINVIFVYFYIFSFYRFAFVFGYLWVGIGLLLLSFSFGRAMKYRFYNPVNFINEIVEFRNWIGHLSINLGEEVYKFIFKTKDMIVDRFVIYWNIDSIFPGRGRSKNSPEQKLKNQQSLELYWNLNFGIIKYIYFSNRQPDSIWRVLGKLRIPTFLQKQFQKNFAKKRRLVEFKLDRSYGSFLVYHFYKSRLNLILTAYFKKYAT